MVIKVHILLAYGVFSGKTYFWVCDTNSMPCLLYFCLSMGSFNCCISKYEVKIFVCWKLATNVCLCRTVERNRQSKSHRVFGSAMPQRESLSIEIWRRQRRKPAAAGLRAHSHVDAWHCAGYLRSPLANSISSLSVSSMLANGRPTEIDEQLESCVLSLCPKPVSWQQKHAGCTEIRNPSTNAWVWMFLWKVVRQGHSCGHIDVICANARVVSDQMQQRWHEGRTQVKDYDGCLHQNWRQEVSMCCRDIRIQTYFDKKTLEEACPQLCATWQWPVVRCERSPSRCKANTRLPCHRSRRKTSCRHRCVPNRERIAGSRSVGSRPRCWRARVLLVCWIGKDQGPKCATHQGNESDERARTVSAFFLTHS